MLPITPTHAITAIFAKIRANTPLDAVELAQYKSAVLYDLCIMDHARNWTQQFHFGALRNNNARMMADSGPGHRFRHDW